MNGRQESTREKPAQKKRENHPTEATVDHEALDHLHRGMEHRLRSADSDDRLLVGAQHRREVGTPEARNFLHPSPLALHPGLSE